DFFRGCDLAGYNILNFDVPLLWEEFYRAGIHWDVRDTLILDVANIFKKAQPRTLSAAVRFYLGGEHAGAHNALADVIATANVLQAQLVQHAELTGKTREEIASYSAMDDRVDLA